MFDTARLSNVLVAIDQTIVGVCSPKASPDNPTPSTRTWIQRSDGFVGVDFISPPTQQQITSITPVVVNFDARMRVSRTLLAIYTDLANLTNTQKNNVWADLASGTPAKYLTDSGSSAGSIACLDWAVRFSGLATAAITDAKLRIAAIYCQDNPNYLVQPAFDNTINVPGDQPVS